jgi:hypothetical protein
MSDLQNILDGLKNSPDYTPTSYMNQLLDLFSVEKDNDGNLTIYTNLNNDQFLKHEDTNLKADVITALEDKYSSYDVSDDIDNDNLVFFNLTLKEE